MADIFPDWNMAESVGGFVITAKVPNKAPSGLYGAYYATIATVTQRDPHPVFGGGITPAQARAHARIMVAGPTMLAALKAVAQQGMWRDAETGIGMMPEPTEAAGLVNAAIAMAEA